MNNVFSNISSTKRLPILFVGSGVSKRYTSNDFSWKELLVQCISLYTSDPNRKYRWYFEKAKNIIDSLENEHLIYQHIGSMVEEDFNLSYFEGKFDLEKEVPDDTSPLKIYISELLKNHLIKDEVKDEVEILKKLKEKMLTVITTNYDTFIEQDIFSTHETIVGQKVFMGSEIGTILKIHGCITDPSSIILTKKDYDRFDKKSKILAAKVLSLFTENPVIFLGYSITDDNVRKLLQDIYTCVDSEFDIKALTERLIFVRYDDTLSKPTVGTHSLRIDGVDIRMTEISLSDYTPLLTQMTELKRITELKELHRLRDLVHDIVIDYDGDKKKIVRLTPEEDFQGDEVVVAIGKMSAMTEMVGARGITSDEIFRDVIFEDIVKIPKEWVVNETLPSILKGNQVLPIHKYIDSIDDINNEKIKEIFRKEPIDFLTNAIKKTKRSYDEMNFGSFKEIYFGDLPFSNKFYFLVLRAVYDSNIDELESFLKEFYETFPTKYPGPTVLRKLVLIFDKKKYKSTP
jgi:hypothetical protein